MNSFLAEVVMFCAALWLLLILKYDFFALDIMNINDQFFKYPID